MSYVDPDYAVSGSAASSDAYNILVDDVKDHEGRILGQAFSGVTVRRTTTQSISTATWTSISYSSEELDVGGWWTSGTNIIVPSGAIPTGYTTILCEILLNPRIAANATGIRQARVLVNGSDTGSRAAGPSLSSDVSSFVGFDWVIVAAADVIVVQVYQDSGSSLNLSSARVAVKRLGGVA